MSYQFLRERFGWLAFVETFLSEIMWDIAPREHRFWTLPTGERFEYLKSRLRERLVSGANRPFDPGLIANYFDAFRPYANAYQYQPTPYRGRVLFLRAICTSPNLTREVISLLQGECAEELIEGSHASLFEPPGSEQVSRAINAAIGCLQGQI